MMTRLIEKTEEEKDEEVIKFKLMVEMIKKGKERKIIEMIGLMEEEIFSKTDGKGRTMLMWCCIIGMEEVIRYLTERMRKEDIIKKDIYGKTALTYLLENEEKPMPKIYAMITKKIYIVERQEMPETERTEEMIMPLMPETERTEEMIMPIMPETERTEEIIMPMMAEERTEEIIMPIMPETERTERTEEIIMPMMPETERTERTERTEEMIMQMMPEERPEERAEERPEEREEKVDERGEEGEDESEIEQRMVAVRKMERMTSESEGERVRKERRIREIEMEKRMEEMKRIIERGGIKEAKNMMMMGINKEVMNYVSRERGETILYYVMRRRLGVGMVEAALVNMRIDILKRSIYAGMTAQRYAAELGEEIERVVVRRLIEYRIKGR